MERITADEQPAATLPPTMRSDRFFSSALNGAELWTKLAVILGINPKRSLKLIGAGSRGMAYEFGSKVLKITVDHTEARAAAIVRDRPDPAGRVVRIERVFILDGFSKFNDVTMTAPGYAIIMERLEKPDPVWADMADAWTAGQTINPDNVENFFKTEQPPKTASPEAWQQFGEWLAGVATYLDATEIEFTDLWEDNIMRRQTGEHVIIDLGYSVSPGRLVDMADQTIAKLFEAAAQRIGR